VFDSLFHPSSILTLTEFISIQLKSQYKGVEKSKNKELRKCESEAREVGGGR
jgi:hypothetical protein